MQIPDSPGEFRMPFRYRGRGTNQPIGLLVRKEYSRLGRALEAAVRLSGIRGAGSDVDDHQAFAEAWVADEERDCAERDACGPEPLDGRRRVVGRTEHVDGVGGVGVGIVAGGEGGVWGGGAAWGPRGWGGG